MRRKNTLTLVNRSFHKLRDDVDKLKTLHNIQPVGYITILILHDQTKLFAQELKLP